MSQVFRSGVLVNIAGVVIPDGEKEEVQAIINYFQFLWPGKVRNIYEGRFPGALKK